MAQIGAQYVQAVDPNPVGSLQAFAGASAPTGWLLCNGSEQPIATYPELYSVLSTTYGALTNGTGGAGSTHFSVPDLRGRMPIGAGNEGAAANNTARNLGVKGGDTRMPQHNHGITDPGHIHQYNVHGGSFGDGSGAASLFTGFPVRETRSTGNNATNISINNAGTGTGDNMPPFLVTNYIIKATSSIPRGGTALGSTPPIVTALPANPQFGEQVSYSPFGNAPSLFQFTGSSWQPLSGRSLIRTIALSAASEARFEAVFLTNFTRFEIVWRVGSFSSTGSGGTRLRFLTGSTDASSSYYWSRNWTSSAGANGFDNGGNSAEFVLMTTGAGLNATEHAGTTTVMSPNVATQTVLAGMHVLREGANPFTMRVGGSHETATAYNGFRIYPTSGTMSGTVSVYGLAI